MTSEEIPPTPVVPENPSLSDIAGLLGTALEVLAWLQRHVRAIDGTLLGVVSSQQVLQQAQANLERVQSRCPADCPYRAEAEVIAEEIAAAAEAAAEAKEKP